MGFWELIQPDLPLKVLDEQSGWILSLLYNDYHDQLILSSSNDGSVTLHKIVSTSSAPILDAAYPTQGEIMNSSEEDYTIKTYDEQEDSVYSLAWSPGSAWIFASISYSSNVIVNLVPNK